MFFKVVYIFFNFFIIYVIWFFISLLYICSLFIIINFRFCKKFFYFFFWGKMVRCSIFGFVKIIFVFFCILFFILNGVFLLNVFVIIFWRVGMYFISFCKFFFWFCVRVLVGKIYIVFVNGFFFRVCRIGNWYIKFFFEFVDVEIIILYFVFNVLIVFVWCE